MAKTFARFTLGDPITQGDIFTLYAANENLPTGPTRPVLLKVFTPIAGEDKASEFRFAAELRALAMIGDAPHVATLYTAGMENNIPWLVLPPATGTIAIHISDTPGNATVLAQVLQEALVGLSAIHSHGLLHNDIKPANLLLTPTGSYRVAELSLAAPATAEITQQADMVRYAAPEVFSREFGKLTPSTDLYALGQIAYEMALGSRQWRAQFPQVFDPGSRPRDAVNPAKWMAWHCSTQTVAPFAHDVQRNFPQRLGDLIARLMAKEPSKRFATAQDALTSLREALSVAGPGAGSAVSAVEGKGPGREGIRHEERRETASASPHTPTSGLRPASLSPPPAPAAPSPASVGATTDSGPMYLIRLRNRQSGPFDMATLQRHVRAGLLSRLHQVSTDGVHWRPATSIEGLFPG